ncbi:MAG: prephenate dehydratase [Geitlerinemataceae cyanobacterium]
MIVTIAHLGPTGTYAETAALAYGEWLTQKTGKSFQLQPYGTIDRTLKAVAEQKAHLAVVPIENSIGGSVPISLDTLWQLEGLKIQQAMVLPIAHALISRTESLSGLKTVYSHTQALSQCQLWLEANLPNATLIATNSTTEALQHPECDLSSAAIASVRAAHLYKLPILAHPINDRPDNCTRFWVMSLQALDLELVPADRDRYVSLAFSMPKNAPGTLVDPLQVLARRGINLSRIESRPTKRNLGEYLFFLDFEAGDDRSNWEEALEELKIHTEVLKIFGHYRIFYMGSNGEMDGK